MQLFPFVQCWTETLPISKSSFKVGHMKVGEYQPYVERISTFQNINLKAIKSFINIYIAATLKKLQSLLKIVFNKVRDKVQLSINVSYIIKKNIIRTRQGRIPFNYDLNTLLTLRTSFLCFYLILGGKYLFASMLFTPMYFSTSTGFLRKRAARKRVGEHISNLCS